MQKLVEGIHQFQQNVCSKQRQFFRGLAKGQHPIAAFVGCSDSRVDPNLLTQTDPGELFIVRNAGNIIPPHGTSNNGEAAALEFAVVGLEVKDIIVCGHNHCGAMKGLLDPASLKNLPQMQKWLHHAETTQTIIQENYGHLSGDALVTATAEENVLVQLHHLQTLPMVAARVNRGDLRVHGWMYKIDTGEVFQYDREAKQFLPLLRQRVGELNPT